MSSSDEDPRDLALAELRHRMKNLLTVVQALVSHTLASAGSLPEASRSIDQRLAAMGRSVDLLVKSDWRPVELAKLVELALAHAAAFPGRVSANGPRVVIEAASVTPLMLALHELETNAIKHGALSNSSGRVALGWRLLREGEQRRLWLQWTESGGPPPSKTSRPGFGSRLATTLLQRQVKGSVEMKLEPTGLTWCIITPLSKTSESSATAHLGDL